MTKHHVSGVDVSDDGDPMTGVIVSQSVPGWFRPVVILGVVATALLAMVALAVLVAFLAPTVDSLSNNWGEASRNASIERQAQLDASEEQLDIIASLRAEIDAIRAEQRVEQQIEDCVTLYYDDIEIAKGASQLVLGDNLATSVLTPMDWEGRRALAEEVLAVDEQLRASLVALEEYRLIDPPPDECPHPRAR